MRMWAMGAIRREPQPEDFQGLGISDTVERIKAIKEIGHESGRTERARRYELAGLHWLLMGRTLRLAGHG